MPKKISGVALALSALLALLPLTACAPKEGPAERAGKKIDKAIDKAGDKVEDIGDKIKDKVDGT